MVGRVDVTTTAKNIHAVVNHRGCVEVSIGWRRAEAVVGWEAKNLKNNRDNMTKDLRMNEAPLHRLKVQAMHITRKLVNHLFKPAENIHFVADDARAVTVSSPRQISAHLRRLPLESPRIEAKQNITHLRGESF